MSHAPAPAPDSGSPAAPPAAFQPYVPASVIMPELTVPAVLAGTVLGIVFGASSLYLVLKVGMTVSASIPVAVLSITLFRYLSRVFGLRRATILENNIVQTTGSAGESIAFGVGVTMPALLILGFDLEAARVMMVASLGGLLGILMMIPLRRAFIVNQHGVLPYPEGTACAKVLIVGEQGGTSAKTVFTGFGLAFAYQSLMQALKLWKDTPSALMPEIRGYSKAELSCEVAPALLGVGYIVGFRISAILVAGGFFAYFGLIPMIAFFTSGQTEPLFPGTRPVSEMAPKDVRSAYLLYIGAGAVATGGFISMFRAMPLIASSIASGVRDLRARNGGGEARLRTERDLPMTVVFAGSAILVLAIAASDLIPTALPGRIVGAGLIVLLGFLFVTVSSRLTGEIGSSSNPISGMTVATLLATCLAFVLLGWVGDNYRLAALCIAGVVCIASSNGGTTSQDLKTGHLVGGTPWAQQIGILIGALTSALVIGFTLLMLNKFNTVYTADPKHLPTVAAPADLSDADLEEGPDGKTYRVWKVASAIEGAQAGRYLVDDDGAVKYLADPAFSDRVTRRDDGTPVQKFTPPQATLFAVIINGIMKGDLPWGLVLMGACVALVVQLTGVSALPFAVGVYLPLYATTPIFIGGLIRWICDNRAKRRGAGDESDTSPAVLYSSGLIAGGAIAGILIAFLAAIEPLQNALDLGKYLPAAWNESNWPAIGMFALMALSLYLVGVGRLLRDNGGNGGAGPGAEPKPESAPTTG